MSSTRIASPARARSSAVRRSASSRCLPTNSGRETRPVSARTSAAVETAPMPSSSRSPRVANSAVVDVASRQIGPTSTSPGAASLRSRPATLMQPPNAMPSPVVAIASRSTSTSPVSTPMRIAVSGCSVPQPIAFSAARRARVGSSACVTGAPNIAKYAPPVDFSTRAPSAVAIALSSCSAWSITDFVRSGPSRVATSADGATSAKRHVTTRCSDPRETAIPATVLKGPASIVSLRTSSSPPMTVHVAT